MNSQNFEILRPKHPELASLGGFAEGYARSDPASALVKLRTMAEHVVGYIYLTWRLPRPHATSLNDLLNETAFRSAVPEVVLTKLHLLRRQGNEAAHGTPVPPQLALARLREAFDVACWIFLRFDGGQRAQIPVYQEPPMSPAPHAGDTAGLASTDRLFESLVHCAFRGELCALRPSRLGLQAQPCSRR